jgi:hypothetical protein
MINIKYILVLHMTMPPPFRDWLLQEKDREAPAFSGASRSFMINYFITIL